MSMNYNLSIEAFIKNPDINSFPARLMFDSFDDDSGIIDDIIYIFFEYKGNNILLSFFPGILNKILTIWQEDIDIKRRFIKFPQNLWAKLMESIPDINPPVNAINQIESILENRSSKQAICLDLLMQMISLNSLFNQLSCIKNILLPSLYSRLENECVYIKNDEHSQVKMRAHQIKNAIKMYEKDEPTIESIICSARKKATYTSSFSEWYTLFEKRYEERTGKKLQISDEQKLAIETNEHSTLVCSSAGSGKTTVLVTRFFYLVECKKSNRREYLY